MPRAAADGAPAGAIRRCVICRATAKGATSRPDGKALSGCELDSFDNLDPSERNRQRDRKVALARSGSTGTSRTSILQTPRTPIPIPRAVDPRNGVISGFPGCGWGCNRNRRSSANGNRSRGALRALRACCRRGPGVFARNRLPQRRQMRCVGASGLNASANVATCDH